jgi:hypothetical protein
MWRRGIYRWVEHDSILYAPVVFVFGPSAGAQIAIIKVFERMWDNFPRSDIVEWDLISRGTAQALQNKIKTNLFSCSTCLSKSWVVFKNTGFGIHVPIVLPVEESVVRNKVGCSRGLFF